MTAEQSPLSGQTEPDIALHNQGLALAEERQYEQAIECFRKALMHNNERFESHFMIGSCYSALGKWEQAVDHLQNAASLKQDNTQCWSKLSQVRMSMGRQREALSAARKARKYTPEPNTTSILQLLCQCIGPMNDFDINPQIVDELTHCFLNPQVISSKLTFAAQRIWLHQNVVRSLMNDYTDGRFNNFKGALADPKLNWPIMSHPLFAQLLKDHLISDFRLEKLLRTLRKHLLEMSTDDSLNDGRLWPNALTFISALAQQCFINEYAYHFDEQEQCDLERVKRRALKDLNPYDIAIIACYESLIEHNETFNVSELGIDSPLEAVFRMQIQEPLEEITLKEALPAFTSIDDEVSVLVKAQYENNPYPRWINTSVDTPSDTRAMIRFQFPHLTESHLPNADLKPDMLVAGCGTGKQPIENALLIPNANFTAIDITASSLAYAKRKTQEMNINNIDYGIADILKLRELDKKFDVIYCGGVLHHMHDPMAGWRVLTDILKPGGFMMIALYSEISRRDVIMAREYISQNAIEDTPEGIRSMRQHVLDLPASHPMKPLLRRRDFYSLSECRDFLFHVQEHVFTTLQLKSCIQQLGLEFLGFQQPMNNGVLEHYKASFPDDPYGLNLENWNEFELQNPDIFTGMYQFWLRKPN